MENPNTPTSVPISPQQYRQQQELAQIDWNETAREMAVIARYQTAYRQSSLMNGDIAAVQKIEREVFAVIYDGPVTVYIPFSMMYSNPPQNLLGTSSEALHHQKNFMTNSIGTKIPFVLTSFVVDEETGMAVGTGSRIQGLKKEWKKYFGPTPDYDIRPDTEVVATVLAVGRFNLYLTVCGMDCTIKAKYLTYRYIQDCRDLYKPGQQIRMKVSEVDLSDPKKPELKFNALVYEKDRCKRNAARLSKGTVHIGTVVTISRNTTSDKPTSNVRLWLNDVEAPAICKDIIIPPEFAHNVLPGATVVFESKGLRMDGIPHGVITRLVQDRSVT